MRRDQVSEGVSIHCQHATPVEKVLWEHLISQSNVEFGKNVTDGYKI